jgi:hypothetical protein
MAVIDNLRIKAIKALPATPTKEGIGYFQYLTDVYDFIYKNHQSDISLAERDLAPDLKIFERQEEAIRRVFDEVFRKAYGNGVVNGANVFNEYLIAKQRIIDQDLIKVATKISQDHPNLAQGLNQILQIQNIPINIKANRLRALFENPNNRVAIEGVRQLDLNRLNL